MRWVGEALKEFGRAVVAAVVVSYILKWREKKLQKFHPQPIFIGEARIMSSSPFELEVTSGVDYDPEKETEQIALERKWRESLPKSWWEEVRLFFRLR